MLQTLSTHSPTTNLHALIMNAEGRQIPVCISTSLLRNKENEIIGGAETFQDLSLVAMLARHPPDKTVASEMITRNPEMGRIMKSLPRLASGHESLLIQGEDGTGKEMLARLIHSFSSQRHNPFVQIKCRSFHPPFFSTDLRKGSSDNGEFLPPQSHGFDVPPGSTLFLQEIAEMDQTIQDHLEKTLARPVGRPTPSSPGHSLRVIAATSCNLEELVKKGAFLPALYQRITRFILSLPPLRKRKEDIPLLADQLISRANLRQNKSVPGVSPETLALLMAYDYPGNINELKNIINHAYARCDGGYIFPRHLPEKLLKKEEETKRTSSPMELAVQATEAQSIIAALKRNNYNRKAAARDLGIHKSTFFRKIKHLGIILPPTDGRFRPQGANDEQSI